MGNSLMDKRNDIITLEEEIKELNRKKIALKKLKEEYYNEYFTADREDYALLTDIPNVSLNEKHVLYDYSVLNVDEIGRLICMLFEKYDKEDCVAKRIIEYDWWENKFGDYLVELPRLVIGKEDEVEYLDKKKKNIIISYNNHAYLDKYPTNNPVTWKTSKYGDHYKASNYNHLVGYRGELSFDYKQHEFIKELVYSLAYYQKQHDIPYMGANDTYEVFKKIYKK